MTEATHGTSGFTGPHRFHMEAWIGCAPFERLLHLTIVMAEDGRATLTMPFLVDYAQGAGLMHGGAIATLADTAVVMAIKSVVAPGSHFATIESKMRYLYPVKQGVITARARIAPPDDRRIEGRASVYDDTDRAVAEFSATFKLARDTRIAAITFADVP